ncbi:hypothetical protein EV189_3658 [Motilibacter rhizosphaerae]|uniref:Uncharacterized protein n=1 Tax=Motilibacter rhizosphaerae TaxID=598652 RepID=A0A4Q7NC37_9ACTN|nr:rhomboid-like protein [Motilibacter rhizosphaerae]RZS80177.1 hypothetical protein EV189_3658 [Motilibacter rhizosphaerae]
MTEVLDRVRRFAAGRDLALAYAAVVLVVTVVIALQPPHVTEELVLDSSTNLANLRSTPLLVLAASAFVTPSLAGLWILVPLVWAYGAAQRWVGRGATVVVAAFGHVFATVGVATLLAAGIAQHQLSRHLEHEPDVGVSYGLAAVLGLLTLRLRGRRRRLAVVGGTVAAAAYALVSQTFTDLGHLLAWGIGLGTAQVAAAVRRAAD